MIAVNETLVYIREKEREPPQTPKRQQKKQIAGIEPVSPAWEAGVPFGVKYIALLCPVIQVFFRDNDYPKCWSLV